MMIRGRHTAAEISIIDARVSGFMKLGVTLGGGMPAGMSQKRGTPSMLLAERHWP